MVDDGGVVGVDDVRGVARSLPRTEEHLIRDRVKFRVGRIVYIAFSRDERAMGFAFPKEERAALVAAEPHKFFLPTPSDMRYNWVEARTAAPTVAAATSSGSMLRLARQRTNAPSRLVTRAMVSRRAVGASKPQRT